MLSVLTKSNNVSHLTVFAKLAVEHCRNGSFIIPCQKFVTGNFLLSRNKRVLRFKTLEEGYNFSSDEPKHFGKIVGLDPNEVEIDEDYILEDLKNNKVKNDKIKKRAREQHNEEKKIDERLEIPAQKIEAKKKSVKFEKVDNNTVLLSSKIPKLKSKKERCKIKQVMLEGKRLIQDAIKAGCKPVSIFFSRVADVEKLDIPDNVKLYKVSYKKIQLWSDVVTSQGVLGVFDMPKLPLQKDSVNSIPLTVICDNIREPGNLGAILRVVAAVGCNKIILTKGCVDLWEPKVLRAAAGSHFRLPAITDFEWTEVENLVEENERVLLADNAVSAEIGVEKKIDQSESFENLSDLDLPSHNYTALDYSTGKTVIIVGGETHGLSKDAYEFAKKRKGVKVCIPMGNEIESLNASVALGIISYEIKRQLEFSSKNEFDEKKAQEAFS